MCFFFRKNVVKGRYILVAFSGANYEKKDIPAQPSLLWYINMILITELLLPTADN